MGRVGLKLRSTLISLGKNWIANCFSNANFATKLMTTCYSLWELHKMIHKSSHSKPSLEDLACLRWKPKQLLCSTENCCYKTHRKTDNVSAGSDEGPSSNCRGLLWKSVTQVIKYGSHRKNIFLFGPWHSGNVTIIDDSGRDLMPSISNNSFTQRSNYNSVRVLAWDTQKPFIGMEVLIVRRKMSHLGINCMKLWRHTSVWGIEWVEGRDSMNPKRTRTLKVL